MITLAVILLLCKGFVKKIHIELYRESSYIYRREKCINVICILNTQRKMIK